LPSCDKILRPRRLGVDKEHFEFRLRVDQAQLPRLGQRDRDKGVVFDGILVGVASHRGGWRQRQHQLVVAFQAKNQVRADALKRADLHARESVSDRRAVARATNDLCDGDVDFFDLFSDEVAVKLSATQFGFG